MEAKQTLIHTLLYERLIYHMKWKNTQISWDYPKKAKQFGLKFKNNELLCWNPQ
jgi:hypothetical protein